MKKGKDWLYHIIAALIFGFICFAVMFWLLDINYKESLSFAFTATTATLFAEVASLYFIDKQRRNKEKRQQHN